MTEGSWVSSKLKFLIFNDYKIFLTIIRQTYFRGFSCRFSRDKVFFIEKRLRYRAEYLHNRERPKCPPTPIIVNISIYLTLEKNKHTKFQVLFYFKYYLCLREYFVYFVCNMFFSSSKHTPKAQNKSICW